MRTTVDLRDDLLQLTHNVVGADTIKEAFHTFSGSQPSSKTLFKLYGQVRGNARASLPVSSDA